MSPSKLLEINLISAQDLPPVSKMLRTFAVAYISPDHKLTTKIDHKGHTNPNWNHKMLFHVDNHFLNQDSSVLTIDIYNLAWLRDLPIGTARLQFNTLSPPLTQSNGYRKISLRICRPSGHRQGTVSLNIQLVDMEDDVSLSSLRISDEESVAEEIKEEKKEEKSQDLEPEEKPCPDIKSTDESICSTPETKYTWQPESEPETRTITSGGESIYSSMRPLPSEAAADLKKGFYKADAGEYGSSIFENWTEGGDRSEYSGRKMESDEWESERHWSDYSGTKTESDEWESERHRSDDSGRKTEDEWESERHRSDDSGKKTESGEWVSERHRSDDSGKKTESGEWVSERHRSDDSGRKTESDEWESERHRSDDSVKKTESDEWESERHRSDDSVKKTESGDWESERHRSDDSGRKTESDEWETERQLIPLMTELPIDTRRKQPEKKNAAAAKNKGIMKRLSNIYAFELRFVCGSNQFKLKKKIRNDHHRPPSDGKLGKFYG